MAPDDAVEDDPDLFDCDDCPVLEHLQRLDGINTATWGLFRTVTTRFAAELHVGGCALDRLTRDMDTETFRETWKRLTLAFDVIHPPPEPNS